MDLWALDEVLFEQYGSACRMWMPPEIKDPVLLHHPTREGIGYFGAVRIRDGKFAYSREVKRFNAETFFTFLKKLRRLSCRAGRRVAVILDNVRYYNASLHRKWREKCQKRFVLLFMPRYSPKLNPIERVWKLTRRMATHISAFRRSLPSLSPLIKCRRMAQRQYNAETSMRTLMCRCVSLVDDAREKRYSFDDAN